MYWREITVYINTICFIHIKTGDFKSRKDNWIVSEIFIRFGSTLVEKKTYKTRKQ